MIASMTGYGKAEAPLGGVMVAVEVRSVNHRFCEVAARLPKSLAGGESRFRKAIQRRVARGRVDLAVTTGGDHQAKRLALDAGVGRPDHEAFTARPRALA